MGLTKPLVETKLCGLFTCGPNEAPCRNKVVRPFTCGPNKAPGRNIIVRANKAKADNIMVVFSDTQMRPFAQTSCGLIVFISHLKGFCFARGYFIESSIELENRSWPNKILMRAYKGLGFIVPSTQINYLFLHILLEKKKKKTLHSRNEVEIFK